MTITERVKKLARQVDFSTRGVKIEGEDVSSLKIITKNRTYTFSDLRNIIGKDLDEKLKNLFKVIKSETPKSTPTKRKKTSKKTETTEEIKA